MVLVLEGLKYRVKKVRIIFVLFCINRYSWTQMPQQFVAKQIQLNFWTANFHLSNWRWYWMLLLLWWLIFEQVKLYFFSNSQLNFIKVNYSMSIDPLTLFILLLFRWLIPFLLLLLQKVYSIFRACIQEPDDSKDGREMQLEGGIFHGLDETVVALVGIE